MGGVLCKPLACSTSLASPIMLISLATIMDIAVLDETRCASSLEQLPY